MRSLKHRKSAGEVVEWQRLFVTLVAAGIGIATAAFLVLAPVPQSFSMENAALYDLATACTGIDTTPGTAVNFHWSSSSFTYFWVVSCSDDMDVYAANGTSGSGALVSIGGVYEFGGSCPDQSFCVPANVAGEFTGPLVPI